MYFNFRLPSEIVPTRSVKVMLKLSDVAEAYYGYAYRVLTVLLTVSLLLLLIKFS